MKMFNYWFGYFFSAEMGSMWYLYQHFPCRLSKRDSSVKYITDMIMGYLEAVSARNLVWGGEHIEEVPIAMYST